MAIRVIGGEQTAGGRLRERAAVLPRSRSRLRLRSDAISTIITVAVDFVVCTLATTVGMYWVAASHVPLPPTWMIAFYTPTLIALLFLRSAYRRALGRTFLQQLAVVQTAAALAAMLLLSGLVVCNVSGYVGATVSKIWMSTAVFLTVGRIFTYVIDRNMRSQRRLAAPVLIVGNGRISHQVAERFIAKPEYGILPVGLVDAESAWAGSDNTQHSLPLVGTPESIGEAIRHTGAEGIVLAFSRTRDEQLTPVIRAARLAGVKVWVVPRMFDTVGKRARVEHVGGLPLLALPHTNPRGWQFAAKHVFDQLGALAILTLISPVFFGLMLAVRLSSPGPIFFRQQRVGRDGIVFDCLKFRSMRPADDGDAAFQLRDGAAPGGIEGTDRRTWIGKIMRSSSLDELPQLLNVLKGEMSLVGPRPERPEFVDLFNMQIRRYGERHRVKAGMTGWAQVHGLRGQTSIADRAEWDNYYIENWSLGLDFQILAMTVPACLRRAE